MKITIIRLSAFESAIARFDAWWDGRSPRERVMLSVLGTLIGGIVLVYGVIFPLQNARARAFADIRTYETLNARIRAAGALSPQRAAPRTGDPLSVVNSSGASFGVVAQVTPIPGGARATIADASYDSLVAWLADLGATSKLTVRRVELTRRAPGRVAAVVDFGS
ncbi:type II secretion system protein M [Sphingomonas sp. LB-2]|uniref:type II secretion system protein M n=1 Tax=Sphingomonas caeni TaxID=2984949 RepID=UPI002230FCCD|nr:type II secretion system protein M [Sphingomonas caeni]MCW3847451.1 type II secretion system protein M [Sphingomonas caeni]